MKKQGEEARAGGKCGFMKLLSQCTARRLLAMAIEEKRKGRCSVHLSWPSG